jgi:hypothetical protein
MLAMKMRQMCLGSNRQPPVGKGTGIQENSPRALSDIGIFPVWHRDQGRSLNLGNRDFANATSQPKANSPLVAT